jgi:hypothetical protein
MRGNCARIGGSFALAVAVLTAFATWPATAAEAVMQPALTPGGHYTRLLGAAPLKPPVLFADDDDAVAAKMETVGWYRHGAPTYAYYRGFGGWYGPWYGYRSYPYWGGYYGPFYGAGGFYGSPYGYYGYSPIGFSNYGVGYRPWGAYPVGTFYPPYYGGGALYPYPPFGLANYGGCCYW